MLEEVRIHSSAFFQSSLLLHLPQTPKLVLSCASDSELSKNGFLLSFAIFSFVCFLQALLFSGFFISSECFCRFMAVFEFVMNHVFLAKC